MEPDPPDSTVRDYVRVLFRHAGVLAATVITVIAIVALSLQWKTPLYEAHVKMLISGEKQVEAPYYQEMNGYQEIKPSLMQSELVKSNAVLERTVRALTLDRLPLDAEKPFASPLKRWIIDRQVKHLSTQMESFSPQERQAYLFRTAVETLRRSITVEPIKDTNLFTITVKAWTPVRAAVIANALSRAYVMFDLEQQLAELQLRYGEKHQTVRQLQDNLHRMERTLHGNLLSNIEAIGPASVKIIEQASMPLVPVGTSKILLIGLSLVASLFLGMLLAFIVDYLDSTVKSPQDIERFLHLPHLSSIPRRRFWNHSLVRDVELRSPYANAYRLLSDQVLLRMKSQGHQALLITAPLQAQGATTVVANLGKFLAGRAGQTVLLIDANLRAPTLHGVFKRSGSLKPRQDTPPYWRGGMAQKRGFVARNWRSQFRFQSASADWSAFCLAGKMPVMEAPRATPVGPPFGLGDVLEHRASLEQAIVQLETGLMILPAGTLSGNPYSLLSSSSMSELIATAKARFDLVLLDCAPLRDFSDATVIAQSVDKLLVVVQEGKTRRHVLNASLSALCNLKTEILGVILNKHRFVIPSVIYDMV